MAANSIRERILLDIKSTLEAVSAIGMVKRKVVGDVSELKEIPANQFPVVFMTAGLPVPKSGGFVTLRESSQSSAVRSILSVQLRTYGFSYAAPDSGISTVAEDIWDVLYADPTVNGLAEGVTVIPQKNTMFFEPYYRFDIIYDVEYVHDTDNL